MIWANYDRIEVGSSIVHDGVRWSVVDKNDEAVTVKLLHGHGSVFKYPKDKFNKMCFGLLDRSDRSDTATAS